ncbi:hypothetical protein CPB85DRAFT_1269145 [Mucidula mucida]|nr:hypothetical protein CPB85DRAFT_1269145 [Mucidula mucida]
MYHQQHLDSPPPTSQFRRPWSPEPFDPNPPSEPYRPRYDNRTQPYNFEHDYSRYPQTRREPSDVSVEALDLADYAATLRRGQYEYPDYPPESYYSRTDYSTPRSQRHHSMPPASDAGIDTTRFPAWSRHWYDSPSRLPPPPQDYDDIYSHPPLRASKGHFDPSYTIHSPPFNAYSPPMSPPPPFSSTGHDSLLPWSLDHPDAPLDQGTKEERIRMLEREFAGVHPAFEPEPKPETLVGTADANGNLITQGPRKRLASRITQILLALAAAIPAIYAAVGIKTTVKPTPSGTAAAYVLYAASCVTFLGLFYYFAIRPCFRKRVKPEQEGIPGLAGMVLPGANQKKKKGKKGKNGYPQQDVHVNLIVDPSMFRPPQDEEEEDWESSTAVSSNAGKKKPPKRKSIMSALLAERVWLIARSRAKKILCLDIFLTLAWLGVFIYIMLGARCAAPKAETSSSSSTSHTSSSSTHKLEERAFHIASRIISRAYHSTIASRATEPDNGISSWCMAWNISSAAACLLAVISGVCVFFGVKDLGASKVSPRQR